MERRFWKVLESWKDRREQEPLLVVGARQVGKTWLIRRFFQERFPDYIYLNLEERPDLMSVFEGSLEPEAILRNLEILLGRKIDPAGCGIFIDEIQKSERAINSLKYFCESPVSYRVIGAGSLLGVKLHRFESSFPVGKVRILHLYPMDFEEFLTACGEELLLDAIRSSYASMTPLPGAVHEKALRLYTDYLYVGGMPRAVQSYIETGENALTFDRTIHRDLLAAYTADMTKYTQGPAEGVKISQTYASVPRQLAKENPKFKYSVIREYANRRDFESSIDWLIASEMVICSTSVDQPWSPLSVYQNPSIFKLYLSDVGLLCTQSGLSYRDLLPETHNLFKGAITENYVIQTVHCRGIESYYYKPDQSMEIDQLVEKDGEVIPIEIKAGRHKRSTSLKNYRQKYEPVRAYRLSELNFGCSDGLYSVPLYAAFCLFDDLK